MKVESGKLWCFSNPDLKNMIEYCSHCRPPRDTSSLFPLHYSLYTLHPSLLLCPTSPDKQGLSLHISPFRSSRLSPLSSLLASPSPFDCLLCGPSRRRPLQRSPIAYCLIAPALSLVTGQARLVPTHPPIPLLTPHFSLSFWLPAVRAVETPAPTTFSYCLLPPRSSISTPHSSLLAPHSSLSTFRYQLSTNP